VGLRAKVDFGQVVVVVVALRDRLLIKVDWGDWVRIMATMDEVFRKEFLAVEALEENTNLAVEALGKTTNQDVAVAAKIRYWKKKLSKEGRGLMIKIRYWQKN